MNWWQQFIRGDPAAIHRTFNSIMMTTYWLAGWSMLVGHVPSAVLDTMGTSWHHIWLVLLLVGPPLSVVGTRLPNRWLGLWVRVAGNTSVYGALIALITAVSIANGALTWTAWTGIGLSACTLLLIVVDLFTLHRAAKEASNGRS
ncbi:hypothetical protein [Gordonia sihwensis]|uniref:hypothetical protein n=1 Tax=Gordonia sihwensis TaxID=173559 RepID=UPI0024169642|nr:hypothetical protein [Gordonia sihwensis]WFN94183.1 hypothetical protein P5P27_06450 [Gordonia sihwensis]WFN94244.1 hypothetical protein P5P27_06760 [Gordonia sihwensis]